MAMEIIQTGPIIVSGSVFTHLLTSSEKCNWTGVMEVRRIQ